MKALLVEFIGTFFLVLTIGCTVIATSSGVIPPLAIGVVLMVMIYAGGHISGAHYNPAVTVGVAIVKGGSSLSTLPGYIAAQVAGATAAALVATYLKGSPAVTPSSPDVLRALIAEFLFTFALVYVILNSAVAKSNAGNSFYGLAIGGTVLAGAFAVGGISGGAFNPAVAVGISVMGLSAWSNIWIFFVANTLGGIAAATVYKATTSDS